jgi:hypothetical protein
MFLDISNSDYDKDIIPFIKNGIIIDTSVMKIIIDGMIETRISKKESPDFERLLYFLSLIKVNNRWNKFLITPHILTETCTHLRNDYSKFHNYSRIVGEVFPLLSEMEERSVSKEKIISSVDLKNPIVEVGDISIFTVTEDYVKQSKKISILVKDNRICRSYESDKNVMIMDYNSIIYNSV